MSKIIIEAQHIYKNYWQGDGEVIAILEDVNFTLQEREIIALLGPSGSGKTTFLNILGMLDIPSKGKLLINNYDVTNLNDIKKTSLRGKNIGFVFQFHHLLPDFTVLENVILPQLIHGKKQKEAKEKALELLSALSMDHRLDAFPTVLSGGEQQRVAIARALACDPSILIADEPTGNLDKKTANEVLLLIKEVVNKYNIGVILATHDITIANLTDKKIKIHNKKIEEY